MINLKRIFDGNDVFKVIGAIVKFENINLNLNGIQSQMFQTILKKYID